MKMEDENITLSPSKTNYKAEEKHNSTPNPMYVFLNKNFQNWNKYFGSEN